MHVEFLVEEPSAEAALENLLPRLLGAGTSFFIHPFNGKADLLANLSSRLRAYRRWLPRDWRIVVLVDEDRQDCRALKGELESAARNAGLMTKSAAGGGADFQVLNRLAIEELEAWFFGDAAALRAAYPRVPPTLNRNARYRDPDAIAGGTAEALERILRRSGYYGARMPKIETARRISASMDPRINQSHSFQVFRSGLAALTKCPT